MGTGFDLTALVSVPTAVVGEAADFITANVTVIAAIAAAYYLFGHARKFLRSLMKPRA